MLSLKPRLDMILRSVPEGSNVADIGTDHAFLPIALIKTGRAKKVFACDINKEPLNSARKNIEKSKTEHIELRLSNGLEKISPEEADTIVIAGMGGDLICEILSRAGWIKKDGLLLLLQPMTSADALRAYLCKNGFEIKKEEACEDSGRVYTLLQATYIGRARELSGAELFIGKLSEKSTPAAKKYIRLQYARVKNCAESLKSVESKQKEYLFWRKAEEEIKEIIDKF